MIWRRKKLEQAQTEADKALQESLLDLHRTVRQGPEVRRLADRLRNIQRENGFAESIRHAYSRGTP